MSATRRGPRPSARRSLRMPLRRGGHRWRRRRGAPFGDAEWRSNLRRITSPAAWITFELRIGEILAGHINSYPASTSNAGDRTPQPDDEAVMAITSQRSARFDVADPAIERVLITCRPRNSGARPKPAVREHRHARIASCGLWTSQGDPDTRSTASEVSRQIISEAFASPATAAGPFCYLARVDT